MLPFIVLLALLFLSCEHQNIPHSPSAQDNKTIQSVHFGYEPSNIPIDVPYSTFLLIDQNVFQLIHRQEELDTIPMALSSVAIEPLVDSLPNDFYDAWAPHRTIGNSLPAKNDAANFFVVINYQDSGSVVIGGNNLPTTYLSYKKTTEDVLQFCYRNAASVR